MIKSLSTLLFAYALLSLGCGSGGGDQANGQDESRSRPAADAEPKDNEKEPVQGKPSNDPPEDFPAPPGTDDKTTKVDCPKYPMVFHHGFMGGSKIGNFKGVVEFFQKSGCKAYLTEVAAVQSSEFRAGQLKQAVDRILAESGAAKIHLVAHSQGGLDGRYMISQLGMGDKVASLSMLGTPNHGTSLADLSLQQSGPLARQALTAMMNFMGKTVNGSTQDPDTMAAVHSLSVAYVDGEFNLKVQDVPGVIYQSWAGVTGSGSGDKTKTLLLLSVGALTLTEGKNDGVVSVKSAEWGKFRGTVPADHMDLIGYQVMDGPAAFDHLKFIADLAHELASQGL